MMKDALIRNAQKVAAAASVALLVGSLVVVPAQAQSKQTIKKMDSTVNIKEAGAAATSILGGEANLNVGGALVTNGATQDIGEMKSTVVMEKSGVAATTILGGKATATIGGATAK
jgi:hypothetical protein